MATRVRSGLYRLTYIIDRYTFIEYDIERNTGDFPHRKINDWIVTSHINNCNGRLHSPDCQFDTEFSTKKDAIQAIFEVMRTSIHYYDSQWGWTVK